VQAPRWPIFGIDAIARAIRAGDPVRVVLVQRDDASPAITALVALAGAHSIEIWRGGPGDLRRMSRGRVVETAIAMAGADPNAADMDALFARGGAVWLLQGATYPSNVGFAIRTAEVSGADGVIVDASFNHHDRSRIAHVTMGADRLMPVIWDSTEPAIAAARARGHRIVALEDVGESAPWQVDLSGAIVLLVGSERDGIAPELLARCDAVVSVPMAGFVPSYNLQAAISAIAGERLRQLAMHRTG
jgi:23S rRNA (guanosine2251-2'-O)-methyltransferase